MTYIISGLLGLGQSSFLGEQTLHKLPENDIKLHFDVVQFYKRALTKKFILVHFSSNSQWWVTSFQMILLYIWRLYFEGAEQKDKVLWE